MVYFFLGGLGGEYIPWLLELHNLPDSNSNSNSDSLIWNEWFEMVLFPLSVQLVP